MSDRIHEATIAVIDGLIENLEEMKRIEGEDFDESIARAEILEDLLALQREGWPEFRSMGFYEEDGFSEADLPKIIAEIETIRDTGKGVLKPTAVIREDSLGIHVETYWSGLPLDRPCTGGWLFGHGKRALAERLKRAVDAGVVHPQRLLTRDMNGKSYVSAFGRVLARRANADLKRLGF